MANISSHPEIGCGVKVTEPVETLCKLKFGVGCPACKVRIEFQVWSFASTLGEVEEDGEKKSRRSQIPQWSASLYRRGSPWGGNHYLWNGFAVFVECFYSIGEIFFQYLCSGCTVNTEHFIFSKCLEKHSNMHVSGVASHLQVDRCKAAASRKQHSCPPWLPPWHAHTKVSR